MSIHSIRYLVAAVWLVAGTMVLKIGFQNLWQYVDPVKNNFETYIVLLLFIASFAFFSFFIFPKVYHKNAQHHLKNYEKRGRIRFWEVFTIDSWVIMAVMIGGSAILRAKGVLPTYFFAGFYPGLGMSMYIVAFRFILPATHRLNAKTTKEKAE